MDANDLTSRLAKSLGSDTKTVRALADALCTIIADNSLQLNNTAVPGFGTFIPVKTDEQVRTGDDGARRLYPPHIALQFSAGSRFKKTVREGRQS